MKIYKIACMAFLLPWFTAKAQYTKLPSIPATAYNVKDFGAVGDNQTLNTNAIQKALDEAAKAGGTVQIPAGQYLCGPLTMHSHTGLEIAKGAVLRLINDMDHFPVTGTRYQNFINVSGGSDIRISGGGTIDGQGEVWWKAVEANSLKFRRPQMVYIEGAQQVEISGVKFLDPPNTHLSLKNTKEVYIHDIVIQAPANSHNTDGINISARNTTIENCLINTGDDNIAINFGNRQQPENDPEVQNMLIRNCFFGYGHGLSIGSFTSGGLRNLRVNHCAFDGTTSGIRIKTARGRGGLISDISYEDIAIKNSKFPIFISEYYPKEPKSPQDDQATTPGQYNPVYRNIRLKNITVTDSQEALIIWGIPESPVQDISFDNVQINAKKGAQVYNASGVVFVNSDINAASGNKVQTYNANISGLK